VDNKAEFTTRPNKRRTTMNAIATLITDCRNAILPTVTIGAIHSCRQGEIVLVYLDAGESNSHILRYDRLSREDRSVIQAIAQDPLSVLERMNARSGVAH
jgi:hypothetical protein